jgi:hypothetical protein
MLNLISSQTAIHEDGSISAGDGNWHVFLLRVCDDLDLMYDYFTTIREAHEAEPIPVHRLERLVDREYCGGLKQAVIDYAH